MPIFSGLDPIVKTNYRLAKHTWYGLGGPADYFIRPEAIDQLQEVVRRCQENGLRMYVLGFGSNLLVSDEGVRGAVIKFDAEAFSQVQIEGESVTAGAGADLGQLVLSCVKKGLSGLEGLTGIPGSIGGAVRMNAGGRFGDIGTAVESVAVMDIRSQVHEKAKPELAFDYRSSNIASRFILGATLRLVPGDPEQIMRTVQEIWIYKKNHQPLNTRNCGCVFKNPPGQAAGALIDRAGLKGLQVGGAKVSEKHANFIVAEKGCTSRDVLSVIAEVRDKVKESSGIELETEIEIWR
jgi:UDP-N-acetylmuramate dehydrogenase